MVLISNEVSKSTRIDPLINPLVSVIIGNYNYGRFLRQSIESVLSQTYKDFELIVVDDGSTDNSREIIESYGDRLIAIFQENAGQIAAHTAGVQKSSGEIICLLDSDDCFHPDKLMKVVESFTKNPKWVQVSHTWTSVDVEGQPIGKSTSNILSQGNVQNLLLKWGKYASGITSALAWRRDVLVKVLPLQQNLANHGDPWIDSFLTATIPFYGEVGCINESLMFYRIHQNNTRAYTNNIDKLMRVHSNIADAINLAAAGAFLSDRFDVRRDPDYRAYEAIQRGCVFWLEALEVVWLSIQESIEIRRSLRDSFIRLIYRSTCVFFPHQSKQILRLGFRAYLLQNLGKKHKR